MLFHNDKESYFYYYFPSDAPILKKYFASLSQKYEPYLKFCLYQRVGDSLGDGL